MSTKGDEPFLWEDSWIKDKPLFLYKNLENATRWLRANQGEIIKDYSLEEIGKYFFKNPP